MSSDYGAENLKGQSSVDFEKQKQLRFSPTKVNRFGGPRAGSPASCWTPAVKCPFVCRAKAKDA
eukprot:11196088-Lingulodinium_polyedra.AAC.1